jgi:hypothetical protein
MLHAVGICRRGFVGALALLIAAATSASAQNLKLSDTIQIVGNTCQLISAGGDKEMPPDVAGKQKCVFTGKLNGFWRVYVPGNKDEIIVCSCKVGPNNMITGTGREGEGPGAYSATITGVVHPGIVLNAMIRVWEKPGAP